MSGFTAIELDKLPAPNVIEALDFETILKAMMDQLIVLEPTLEAGLELESEPSRKILEVCAYRELLLRQRINEASKAVMLAYALDEDLDHIGATFKVTRLLIDAGDPDALPPLEPTYESNDDYRRRIQLSHEGYSTAGPEGAYIFHALSSDADVLDASATSPTPGDVVVSVLSRTGDGTAAQALLDTVDAILTADGVRPLTDNVTIQSATIVNYTIDATLYFFNGPDSNVVYAQAQTQINDYVASLHRLGQDITLSGIYAALHQPGVQRVELTSPAADIAIDRQSAGNCTSITITDGGTSE